MTQLNIGVAPGVSTTEFRGAVGQFVTGITVVSVLDEQGRPYGMTASSFCSLSLNPPLIQWSITTESFSFQKFQRSKYFAINILASDQEDVSRNFCKPIDRFATVSSTSGLHGLPLIDNCLAWLECEVEEMVVGGDHTIFIGRVLRSRVFDKGPLLHWRGKHIPLEA
ncbi:MULTISPECIES: flavin reductase family protein [Pseudomonas]|uniref:NADH-FMN oxidoreductase RutF, flavin reductase (DIM6/NTAB) family n=3 Tax=Pseudomonas TaxID=286 RepID=A0A1M7KGF3_9PSED|nr:hypothetical protein ALP97_200064 [Pseudomonas salomonii]RZI33221.1 flavin reductase [Pseudomonas orientalis]SHM64401.1 NADH-FMN oxidoreductase RutF, flavin reductase (DIM6/NTAB) family [Pseudomonas asturiensis]